MTITQNGYAPGAIVPPAVPVPAPPRWRSAVSSAGHGAVSGWRWAAGKVRPWRLARQVPALGGAAMAAAGSGVLLQSFAGAGGWGLGLLAGGAFLLRIDSRI